MKKFVAYVVVVIIAILLPLLICEITHDELVTDIVTFKVIETGSDE
jgi:hypothetical protein